MAETDLLWNSFVCKRDDYSVRLDLVPGVWAPVEVRGGDDIIVGMPGRLALTRVEDRIVQNMVGWVHGLGATPEERWASFYATMTELREAFVLDAFGTIVVTTPYLGLDDGTLSMTARPTSVAYGKILSVASVQVDIELECVGNPPEWIIGT